MSDDCEESRSVSVVCAECGEFCVGSVRADGVNDITEWSGTTDCDEPRHWGWANS